MPDSFDYFALYREPWRSASIFSRCLLVALVLSTAICGWSFFAYYESTLSSSSATATETQTAELNDHGHIHYITPEQSQRVSHWFMLSFALTAATIGYVFYFIRFFQTVLSRRGTVGPRA